MYHIQSVRSECTMVYVLSQHHIKLGVFPYMKGLSKNCRQNYQGNFSFGLRDLEGAFDRITKLWDRLAFLLSSWESSYAWSFKTCEK